MNVPEDLRYSADHEWVKVEGERARIGITDYAQDALGDVVYVQVPPIGATVKAGESFSEIESTKSVSDVYAPVTGTIVEVNADLADIAAAVERRPLRRGVALRHRDGRLRRARRVARCSGYRALVES